MPSAGAVSINSNTTLVKVKLLQTARRISKKWIQIQHLLKLNGFEMAYVDIPTALFKYNTC